MFSLAAPRYDRMNRIISMGRDRVWRRRAARLAGFPPGGRILDLGTGTGDMVREVLRRDPGSAVYGADNCPAMLRHAMNRGGLERARLVIADGGMLPFRAGTFDGAAAAFIIRNLPDASAALSELRRVMRRGGRLALLDMVRPEGLLGGAVFRLHVRRIVPVLGRYLGSDPEAYAYLPRSIESFYSAEELRAALPEHGFDVVHFREVMCRTGLLCICEAR
jgi:demethylmenaquinone methyltransferase / 2-methoxy-6-polyprenyl-1,4-benzoquinol methylase